MPSVGAQSGGLAGRGTPLGRSDRTIQRATAKRTASFGSDTSCSAGQKVLTIPRRKETAMKEAAFRGRLERLREAVDDAGLRGVIVAPGPNMKYLTGVNSMLLERPFLLFVPVEGQAHLVAPKLEAGPYRECPLKMAVHDWTDSEGAGGAVKAAARALRPKGKWGVEGRVPFLFLSVLTKYASPKLKNAEPVLQGVREVKDEAEVALLKKSAEILSRSFEAIPQMMSAGMTEAELGRKVAEEIYSRGAEQIDAMIVQSGPRTSDPHGLATQRRIGRGESVILDISSTYGGYYADVTRTFVIGESREVESVYARVLEAQSAAIRAAKEGAAVGKVDGAARKSLDRAGLGKYFIHRTGHGLGLEVHEAPYIVDGGKERLKERMFFTVEPGAYTPGKFGVRIEDDLMIEGGKGVPITDPPKDYGWWK